MHVGLDHRTRFSRGRFLMLAGAGLGAVAAPAVARASATRAPPSAQPLREPPGPQPSGRRGLDRPADGCAGLRLPRAVGRHAARAAHRRRPGRAGLVPPDAALLEQGRAQLPRADIRRPAGAHLVGGRLRQRLRAGRVRRPRLELRRSGSGRCRQRVRGRPARVHDHSRRHGADQRLQRGRRRSFALRRPGRRDAGRRRRPGDPHRERRASLRVAQRRPRHRRRVLPAVRRRRLGLLPPQLDRPARRRRPPHLRPPHVDDLQARPADGGDRLAARRQEERLRHGRRDAVRLPARRPRSRRRARLGLRRRRLLRGVGDRARVARDRRAARHRTR